MLAKILCFTVIDCLPEVAGPSGLTYIRHDEKMTQQEAANACANFDGPCVEHFVNMGNQAEYDVSTVLR